MELQARAPRPVSSAVATVPGKIILMGEHAVVYGRPALVATLGLRVTVRATREESSGPPSVGLDLRDLDYRSRFEWPELMSYADRARAAWELYARDPTPERFAAVSAGDPAHLVKVALGELAREVASAPTSDATVADLPPASLRVQSELPLGSGFGSSAATAVGVLAAGLALLGGTADADTLDRLALEVERRQHGMPSGADHNTVLRGGVLKITREDGGSLSLQPIEVPLETLALFSILHTGTPAESTGEVVAAVRQRHRTDRAGVESLLDRMGAAVLAFCAGLERTAPDLDRLAELVREYEECLERLGVVPDSVRRQLAEAAAAGMAGKISGAGGLSESGAGSLLVLRGESEAVAEALADYTSYSARLGVPGLELEVHE